MHSSSTSAGVRKYFLIQGPKVDWVQVMVDLHNAGCSAYKVAIHLDVAENTARHWAKGGEPGYGRARALLLLHTRYLGASTTILRITEGEQRAYKDSACEESPSSSFVYGRL
jgi:hypothetical protein